MTCTSPDCHLRNNQTPLFGVGKSNKIMIVAAKPDRAESVSKEPFATPTMGFMKKLMSSSGLNPDEMFFTYLTKCSTPYQREPAHKEILACIGHLIQEVIIHKPKLILALGDIPALILTEHDIKYRGCFLPLTLTKTHECDVLILENPYNIVKYRKEIPVFAHDLMKINARPPIYELHYHFNPPIEEAKKFWESWKKEPDPLIAIDIETKKVEDNALNPWKDTVIGIAFCGKEGEAFSFNLSSTTPERWKAVKEFVEDATPKVLQNNTFDRAFLEVHKGIVINNTAWDTMDAMYVIYSDGEKSLDHLRSLYTSLPPYKHLFKLRGKVSHLTPNQLSEYACRDVDSTLRVARAQKRSMSFAQTNLLQRLLKYDAIAIKMRLRGLTVDKNALVGNAAKMEPQISSAEQEIEQQYGVNINSPKQLGKLLFEDFKMEIPARARKKASGFSVDETRTVTKNLRPKGACNNLSNLYTRSVE
jgi:uracil-DNA glycosylase family 4